MKWWENTREESNIDFVNRIRIERKKQTVKKYRTSEKGKYAIKKCDAQRQRNLGWIPLINDNPFPCRVDWHHIDDFFVIPIPSITHISTYGSNHRERCNMWINKLFGFIGEIINGDL